MSLLMQALKKAEHAKQKQSGVRANDEPAEKGDARAPDDALSLSPKDAVAEPAAMPDAAADTRAAPAQIAPDSLKSALTLSPHSDERTGEPAPAEPALAGLPIAQPEPTPPENIFDATAKAEKLAEDSKAVAPRDSTDRADVAEKDPARPNPLRIGAEQKHAAVQAEKAVSTARQKARSVFSSKIPARNRRYALFGIVGLAILAVYAGVAYFYLQTTSIGTNPIIAAAPQAPLPAPVLPAANPDAASTVTAASAPPGTAAGAASATTVASVPSQAASGTPLTALGPNVLKTAAPVANEGKKAPERNGAAVQASADSSTRGRTSMAERASVAQAAQPPDSSAIQIRQSSSGNQVNPALSGAYQSFISGDTASARLQYQKVLQQEPANRDALLGMAAIALNQRQAEQAGSYYGKMLEFDPNDPDAIAGLTSLQQGDPVKSESRLKRILNQNPQSGAILFALGNLYAQQARWPDAQQTYFRAYTTAPANADFAFNLAVSLDRLNQPRLAQEYYQRALVLGQSGPGNFSRSGVKKRISELETPADE